MANYNQTWLKINRSQRFCETINDSPAMHRVYGIRPTLTSCWVQTVSAIRGLRPINFYCVPSLHTESNLNSCRQISTIGIYFSSPSSQAVPDQRFVQTSNWFACWLKFPTTSSYRPTPCPQIGATLFLALTLPNAKRFSKFFYWQTYHQISGNL